MLPLIKRDKSSLVGLRHAERDTVTEDRRQPPCQREGSVKGVPSSGFCRDNGQRLSSAVERETRVPLAFVSFFLIRMDDTFDGDAQLLDLGTKRRARNAK